MRHLYVIQIVVKSFWLVNTTKVDLYAVIWVFFQDVFWYQTERRVLQRAKWVKHSDRKNGWPNQRDLQGLSTGVKFITSHLPQIRLIRFK